MSIIWVRQKLNGEAYKRIRQEIPKEYEVVFGNPFKEGGNLNCSSVEVIVGNPRMEELEKCQNVKWIQLGSSGADKYLKCPYIKNEEIMLTTGSGAYGEAISEYLVAVTFMVGKKLHLYQRQQMKHVWRDLGEVKTIKGSKVLIVGLGDIGGFYGKKMEKLGCEIYGVKRTFTRKPDYCKEVFSIDKLIELIPKMDVILLALPGSDSTVDIFTKKQFRLLKDGAIFINVGRSSCINQKDLVVFLKERPDVTAVIDVCNQEPLPEESGLYDIDNLIITPHVAGGLRSELAVNGLTNVIVENIKNYFNREKMNNLIDLYTGEKIK